MSAPGAASPGERTARAVAALLFAVYAVLGLLFVFTARVNIDEGMHLNAGRLLWEGMLPYRDFPFSQGPVGPVLYGIAGALGEPLLAGRLLSFLGSLLTAAAVAWLARRHAGWSGTALGLALLCVNFPALWTFTTVRTEPLSVPLVMGAACALAVRPRGALGWAAAPSLLLWATGIRLTNALALTVVALWVLWQLRGERALALRVVGLLALQAALVFGLPLLLAPEQTVFHLVTAQATRGERAGLVIGSLREALLRRLTFATTTNTNFFPLVTLGLAVGVGLVQRWRSGWRPALRPPLDDPWSLALALLVLAALAFAPHLALETGFFSYFVTASALLTAAAAVAVGAWCRSDPESAAPLRAVVWGLVAVAAAYAFLHVETWIRVDDPSLAQLRRMAEPMRRLSPDECTVATFETYLPVAAGCRVLPGLEYSYFSYFPALATSEARRRGVLNHARLNQRVRALRPEFVALDAGALRLLGSDASGASGADGSRERRLEEAAFRAIPAMRGGYAFHASYPVTHGPRILLLKDPLELHIFVRTDLRP